MLYRISVIITVGAVCAAAVLTVIILFSWARESRLYRQKPENPTPPRVLRAVPERKYICKRYTGPLASKETELEYLADFRLQDGTTQTIVVPYKVWKDMEVGKTAELLVQDDFPGGPESQGDPKSPGGPESQGDPESPSGPESPDGPPGRGGKG